jgi:transcriptional regulator with XRE-family HTH domain
MDISKRLIHLRKQCGYTQNGLAERAGVSQTHLRRVELGQADITVGHLQLLCDAMSISLREFFEEETNTDEVSVAFSKLSPKQQKLLLAFLEDLGNNKN